MLEELLLESLLLDSLLLDSLLLELEEELFELELLLDCSPWLP